MEGLIFGVFRYANSIKTIIEFQAKTHYYHQSQLQLFLDGDIYITGVTLWLQPGVICLLKELLFAEIGFLPLFLSWRTL